MLYPPSEYSEHALGTSAYCVCCVSVYYLLTFNCTLSGHDPVPLCCAYSVDEPYRLGGQS